SNGARLRPYTSTMQELVRMDYDFHMESFEDSQLLPPGLILSLRKCTPVSSNLTLIHAYVGQFLLRPSLPLSLQDLNNTPGDFYNRHALCIDVDEWMEANEYATCIVDDDVEGWTRHRDVTRQAWLDGTMVDPGYSGPIWRGDSVH
ncbi:hypothetical protein K470DRAFT_223285, partial [Piedraia hortae CBS 480.64]